MHSVSKCSLSLSEVDDDQLTSKSTAPREPSPPQASGFHAQRTGTRRSELRRGQRWRLHCARAAACAALRVACLAAPTARRERVGDRADRKQRKKTRAARCLLAAAEACTRRRGQYGGVLGCSHSLRLCCVSCGVDHGEKLAAAASSSAAGVRVFARRRQQGGSELALATGL